MQKIFFYILIGVCLLACKSKKEPTTLANCKVEPAKFSFSQNQLIAALRDDLIRSQAESNAPLVNGAMGRNKTAYFHVRFQMGIVAVADYAIDKQDLNALEMAVKAIEYSFQYQKNSGDFEVQPPANLAYLGSPTEGDLASGVAFFASSLGAALMAFQESSWFAAQATSRNRIEALRNKIVSLCLFLKSKKDLLMSIDAQAPKRLLYDAVAFYSLGRYVGDAEMQQTAIDFGQKAITAQHPSGYYIEGGGWDSSYQSVAMALGFRLLCLLPTNHAFYTTLYNSLACATHWQSTRIQPSGEISLEGNTRVYPGGEAFLGEEKQLSWLTTVTSFLVFCAYTDNQLYKTQAEQIIAKYR